MKQDSHLTKTLFPILIIFVLNSCYPSGTVYDPYIVDDNRQKENYYYIPSSANVPLLKEKNDISASLQVGLSEKIVGVELQAVYLPHKNIGIMAGYSNGRNNQEDLDANYADFSKRRFTYNRFEAGAGYITHINKLWHFETYAGFGSGKVKNTHHTGFSKSRNNYFFLQPAVAVSSGDGGMQFGIISKFSGNHFKITDTTFAGDREPYSAKQVSLIADEPFHILWEPAFVFRAGWKNFLVHAGYSFCADLTNNELHRTKGIFSAGVCLKFNMQQYDNILK